MDRCMCIRSGESYGVKYYVGEVYEYYKFAFDIYSDDGIRIDIGVGVNVKFPTMYVGKSGLEVHFQSVDLFGVYFVDINDWRELRIKEVLGEV